MITSNKSFRGYNQHNQHTPLKMEPSGTAEADDPMALGTLMSDGIQGKRRRDASQEDGVDAFQAVSSSSALGTDEDGGGVSIIQGWCRLPRNHCDA